MRTPDLNRVKKAITHLEAADTLLGNIKWENISNLEDSLKMQARDNITSVLYNLQDIINSQK